MNIFFWNTDTLEFIRINKQKLLTVLLVVLITIIGVSYIAFNKGVNKGKNEKITEKDVILLYHESENNGFTRRKFYNYLKEINVKFPNIVFAQSLKECGFKSNLFKNNNNLFGMKHAELRPNTQSGEENGHAYYTTWKNSVIDYALYQSYVGVNKIKTEDEYLNYLKEMQYFDVNHPTNVTYLSDLKEISSNIEKYLKD